MPDVLTLRWRTGRKLGRTVYAMPWPNPTDEDILLGRWNDALECVACLCRPCHEDVTNERGEGRAVLQAAARLRMLQRLFGPDVVLGDESAYTLARALDEAGLEPEL